MQSYRGLYKVSGTRERLEHSVKSASRHRTVQQFDNHDSRKLRAMRWVIEISFIVLFGVAAVIAALALAGPFTW
jgi:hypothetical protein